MIIKQAGLWSPGRIPGLSPPGERGLGRGDPALLGDKISPTINISFSCLFILEQGMSYDPLQHLTDLEELLNKYDDTVMFLTINPSDYFWKKFASEYDLQLRWKTMVIKFIKHIDRCSDYYAFMPEVSDMGRLHMHGWLIIKDRVKWIKSVLPKIRRWAPHGHKVSKCNWGATAFDYYKKDLDTISQLLPSHYYPITSINIKDVLHDMQAESIWVCDGEIERFHAIPITKFFTFIK